MTPLQETKLLADVETIQRLLNVGLPTATSELHLILEHTAIIAVDLGTIVHTLKNMESKK